MLARTFRSYKTAYQGLSTETWWLSFVMLINRSGTMVVPFMTIYLTSSEMNYTISQAGIVMGLFGLGAIAGAHISGKLTDKFGFYPIQIITLGGGGLLFIILGMMKTYHLICVFTFLLSFVNEAFRPANSTAIAFYSKEHNRTRSYSLNRLAINLGWALGNAIGGLLASIDYQLLFWFDGITNIAAAILMWILLSPANNGRIEKKKDEILVKGAVYKDKIYLWFILLVMIFATCFFQLFTNLTAYYRNELKFSERFIGILGALNGLIIAVFEMVLIFRLEGRRPALYYISRGVLLCSVAYLVLATLQVGHWWVVCMVLLITAGEMLSMPFMNSFWISRTQSHNRGEYAALYTIAWASAQTFGPVAGAFIAQYAGYSVLWWVIGLSFLAVAFGYLQLKKFSEIETKALNTISNT